MLRHRFRWLIAARNNDEWHVPKRCHATRRGCGLFECRQMLRHCAKALRLAPERLHEGVDIGWELPHLADESLQRARGGWPEDSHEVTRNAWCAASQQRQTGTHDACACEKAAETRKLNPAPQ